jgi:surface antigen
MFRNRLLNAAACGSIALALGLTACETDSDRGKEQVGVVVGAIAGALIGSQFGKGVGRSLATVAGGLAGAWLGGRTARWLNDRDRNLAKEAADKAMTSPVGTPVTWSNPDSGNSGHVTPLAERADPKSGTSCRRYEQAVTTRQAGTETAHGTACRQPDGTWRIVR